MNVFIQTAGVTFGIVVGAYLALIFVFLINRLGIRVLTKRSKPEDSTHPINFTGVDG